MRDLLKIYAIENLIKMVITPDECYKCCVLFNNHLLSD